MSRRSMQLPNGQPNKREVLALLAACGRFSGSRFGDTGLEIFIAYHTIREFNQLLK